MGFLKRMLGVGTKPSKEPRVVLSARLSLPEQGSPEITWQPAKVATEQLGLFALCYGAHVGWTVGEFHPLRSLLWALAGPLGSLREKQLDNDDLFELVPMANSWRLGLLGHPTAVAGGEVYDLTLIVGPSPTPGSTTEVAIVDRASTPHGVATNLPWSAFLVTAEVWRYLDTAQRARLVDGWKQLKKLLTKRGSIQPGNTDHLHALYESTTSAWAGS